MVGSKLTEPVLCVAFDAVEKIQGGEDTLGGLWTVFTKVKDNVADGRRLENITWRLWHRARIAPKLQFAHSFTSGLSRYPEMLPRPLSSPSLSFSSSSEGTGTSSDWDRDTAVGEDDELQGLHSLGARRNPAVSPHSEKARLDLALGTRFQQARASPLPSPALSSRRCHQLDSSQDPLVRISPSASSDSTPHQLPQTDADAGGDACRDRAQGISHSESQDQSAIPAQSNPGLEAPSSTTHDSTLPRTTQDPTLFSTHLTTVPRTTPLGFDHPLFATEVLAATVTASSMPINLPSLTGPRKEALTVGRIIAELFPEKLGINTAHNMGRLERETHDRVTGEHERQNGPRDKLSRLTPTIVEPQPSTPPVGPSSSSWFQHGTGLSPTSNSAATSATSTPRQAFPTVVVVNPTPHPTPPATPSTNSLEAAFGPRSPTPPVGCLDCPDKNSDNWQGSGSVNGQLATPVSMNGDARSMSPNEPTFVMVQPKAQPFMELQLLDPSVTMVSTQTSLLPAATIALPERPNDFHILSHLPTPSSDSDALDVSEMTLSSKSTPAPIPAPPPSEDKKFFLAAPHSGSGGSGHDSSESPDSLGVGNVSPEKCPRGGYVRDMVHAGPLLGARDAASHVQGLNRQDVPREDEVASSFSASSPSGRAPSVTSSRGGSSMASRFKGRTPFSVASGSKRKQASKKVVQPPKQGPTMGNEVEVKHIDEMEVKQKEQEKIKGKGKEREPNQGAEAPAVGPSTHHVAPAAKPSQEHRSQPQSQHPSQNLRQLPTNPPRQQPPPARRPVPDVPSRPNPPQPPTTREEPPYHPQLGHFALGHLPTVPPRPRRPIEITETSSEYETTDTDGDESSWESESCSGDEAGEGDAHEGSRRPTREAAEVTANGRTSRVASNNRTRDAGQFARDAALEEQRQRELFKKLPSRSYSHLAHLPRAKSGLSLLFRPDPELFPEGHPYRTTRSSHDILARNWSAPAPPLALAAVSKRGTTAGPAVNAECVVSSVNSRPNRVSTSDTMRASGPPRSGHRPRGRPEGQEEETDSGDDDPKNAIQVSSSVVERKLAAIMGKRPTQQQLQRQTPSRSNSHPEPTTQTPGPQPVSRTITAPVLMHPYLPDPAPLQTPHTVRRNIISQELDEELRRNLLWERSQNQIQGRPARAPGSILPGPWRPLTALKSEDGRETQSNASDKAPGKRPFATQRTKSWAGDYHASGW